MCDFMGNKNLACASRAEQKCFFDSFDCILSDMDGVIWVGYKPLPGTAECVQSLKTIGKTVSFVTNNGTISTDTIYKLLQNHKFSIGSKDIVNPITAYITVLHKLGFEKTAFVLGSTELQEELKKAGFKVAQNPPHPVGETISEVSKQLEDDKEIGAVIIDYDINLSMMKLQKALMYLRRSDCYFIIGASDKSVPFPQYGSVLGNYYFIESLKDLSGRKPLQMAKPSSDFTNFIMEQFNFLNPKRVLFIGDSITEDMQFATNSGFQKLLVLTGVTKIEDVHEWKHEEKYKPQYYVDSIGALNLILGKLKIKEMC
ncbi:uncharacterized protein LOC126885735 isoform X2 [Diabrotica virgifera virgifera]|uniref:4-nitrophenylphosphatase-like n=1 Tax=Diabrotica virgifera virgifera TaxID=50390 RepID=A0ABM5KE82_DIAVI|nr:uncharacterized protein LOC126885735 isoform X2 [Diabrotica virgifera virgifera]